VSLEEPLENSSSPLHPNILVTSEEVDEYLDTMANRNPKKIICICGHAMSKHSEPEINPRYCATGKLFCMCQNPTPVILVEDARFFVRATYGWGPKHAFSLGLNAYLKTGKAVNWLCEPVCFVCGVANLGVSPASANRGNRLSSKCDYYNGFFCREHILTLMGMRREVPSEDVLGTTQ